MNALRRFYHWLPGRSITARCDCVTVFTVELLPSRLLMSGEADSLASPSRTETGGGNETITIAGNRTETVKFEAYDWPGEYA